jgi:spore coat polysaccharide biosynthesis predicted glycosyltransferase SpsG
MARADLAITGGGSTVYESAYLGLPSILLELADNQAAVCRAMDAAGTARFAGRASQLNAIALGQMVARLLSNPDERRAMSQAGQSLVDGQGAERVAAALESLAAKSRVVSAA